MAGVMSFLQCARNSNVYVTCSADQQCASFANTLYGCCPSGQPSCTLATACTESVTTAIPSSGPYGLYCTDPAKPYCATFQVQQPDGQLLGQWLKCENSRYSGVVTEDIASGTTTYGAATTRTVISTVPSAAATSSSSQPSSASSSSQISLSSAPTTTIIVQSTSVATSTQIISSSAYTISSTQQVGVESNGATKTTSTSSSIITTNQNSTGPSPPADSQATVAVSGWLNVFIAAIVLGLALLVGITIGITYFIKYRRARRAGEGTTNGYGSSQQVINDLPDMTGMAEAANISPPGRQQQYQQQYHISGMAQHEQGRYEAPPGYGFR